MIIVTNMYSIYLDLALIKMLWMNIKRSLQTKPSRFYMKDSLITILFLLIKRLNQ